MDYRPRDGTAVAGRLNGYERTFNKPARLKKPVTDKNNNRRRGRGAQHKTTKWGNGDTHPVSEKRHWIFMPCRFCKLTNKPWFISHCMILLLKSVGNAAFYCGTHTFSSFPPATLPSSVYGDAVRPTRISRGFAPSPGPITPRSSNTSISRAARAYPRRNFR